VFVDPHSLVKLEIPDWLRQALSPWVMSGDGRVAGAGG
jgi:hypothetical protein